MQTGDTCYIYQNDLDKTYLQHGLAYVSYKDLVKRTESDKVLRNKAFKIASNPRYGDYERKLASIVYKFFDQKSAGSSVKSIASQQLADELQKPITGKFKKCKAY